jgi:hypothetical protein
MEGYLLFYRMMWVEGEVHGQRDWRDDHLHTNTMNGKSPGAGRTVHVTGCIFISQEITSDGTLGL